MYYYQLDEECDFGRCINELLRQMYQGDLCQSAAISAIGKYVGTSVALELVHGE